jgi:hypothetical protein
MLKKKLFLISLIIIVILLFGVPITAVQCEDVAVSIIVSPATITTGSIGTVIVNVTGYSGNVSELNYECIISDGTINTVNENVITLTAPDEPGTIKIGVIVRDQSGEEIASDSIEINISEAENANVDDNEDAIDDVEDQGAQDEKVIADLTALETIATGSEGVVNVGVTGYSGNMSELIYSWYILGDGTINNVNNNATTFTASDDPGTITIGVTVSDQSGVVATDTIQVTVVQTAQQGVSGQQDQEEQQNQTGAPKPIEGSGTPQQ